MEMPIQITAQSRSCISDRPIRVLRVIARLNMGGPAKHVGILSGRRMEARGYETLLVHGSLAPGEESLQEFAEGEGAELVYLPDLVQPIKPGSDQRAFRELTKLVRRFKPDVVHTHTAKGGFVGRSAAMTLRPRPVIVHTYHGHVLEGYFGRGKTAVYRGLEKTAGRVSDRLIGVSQATVDDLIRLGVAPRDRFSVVPLGLDLDPFTGLDPAPDLQARRDLGITGDEMLFSFVGRIVPIKRVDLLLEALAKARGNGARVQLAIAGDGETRSDLEEMAGRLGIADSVHFLGYRRDLATIAAASDAVILSSDNEGTPVSLIEASAAARPGVATSVGGVREVVTDQTGILVPPDDVDALAAGIERLAGDPGLRAAMGRRAREHAMSRYSAERLVGDIDSLYRELLGARTGPGRPAKAGEAV
jgi:glycosyltransferase involved in cell wall biosynthesis